MSSLPSNHSPLPPVPAEKKLAGFPQPALLGMSAPVNSPGSGNESQPVLGNKPQASSNCRGSCRSLASCAQLRRKMRATSVVAPPWADGSCWDQELQGKVGPWEGWRSQGRRMERVVTLHTSFSSRICMGDVAVVQRRQRSPLAAATQQERQFFSDPSTASFTQAANINPSCT